MSVENKHKALKEIFTTHNIVYYPLDDTSLEKVYNLFVNNIVTEPTTNREYISYGIYYYNINIDYVKVKKYYDYAIENNSVTAMNNLGIYYEDVEKNMKEAKKLYLMAVKDKCSLAIYNLARYYKRKQKWEKALEIYLVKPKKFEKDILGVLQKRNLSHVLLSKYIKNVSNLQQENSELKLENSDLKLTVEHLKYKPGKVGAKQAEEHFKTLL